MTHATSRKQAKHRKAFFNARETHDILAAIHEMGKEQPGDSWQAASLRAAFFSLNAVVRGRYKGLSSQTVDETFKDLTYAEHDAQVAMLRYKRRKPCATSPQPMSDCKDTPTVTKS